MCTNFNDVGLGGVIEHDFAMGTQGLLFPRAMTASLISYLQSLNQADFHKPTDDLLWEWRRESNVRQFVVLPCLLQHNGVLTSLSWKQEDHRQSSLESRLIDVKFCPHFDEDPRISRLRG